MFGHGEKHCNVNTFCPNCTGNHKLADCDKPDVSKCANCNGDHKANDPICKMRSNFFEIRKQIANRNNSKLHNLRKRGSVSNQPNFSMSDFPALPTDQHQNKARSRTFPIQTPTESSELIVS